MKWETTLSNLFCLRFLLKADFSQFIWNSRFKVGPSWVCDSPSRPQCSVTHVICRSSSSRVVCGFVEVKDLEEAGSGTRKVLKRSGSQKERKNPNTNKTKPHSKPNKTNTQRKKRKLQRKHLLLEKRPQSWLITGHFKESCVVIHCSGNVRMFSMDFSQRLTLTVTLPFKPLLYLLCSCGSSSQLPEEM